MKWLSKIFKSGPSRGGGSGGGSRYPPRLGEENMVSWRPPARSLVTSFCMSSSFFICLIYRNCYSSWSYHLTAHVYVFFLMVIIYSFDAFKQAKKLKSKFSDSSATCKIEWKIACNKHFRNLKRYLFSNFIKFFLCLLVFFTF